MARVSESRLDPILLEVLWNRLVAVVEEQARALMRTSFTSVVREAGDLSAGLFDQRGRMVAQAVTGTPGHVNAMATSVHHFLREIPAGTLEPGDVMITNHPWQTSGHLNDFTVITPIFHDGTLTAYFGNCCHALDVGGRGLGADARQVYEEGLFVPVTRLFRRGEPNEELFRIIRANVRAPFEVIGDLYAQAASNDVGGARLVEMVEEFDLGDIESLSDEVCSRSERAMREAIEALADGVYENEAYTDGFDEPIRLAVSIRVDGDEMFIDFEGSSPQSERGINVVLNYTAAYTTFGVKCAISPEVPNNDGSFQPVHVTAPRRVHPQRPSPRSGRGEAHSRSLLTRRDPRRTCEGHPRQSTGPGRRQPVEHADHRATRRWRAFHVRILFRRRHGSAPGSGRVVSHSFPQRHPRRAGGGHREHLPSRHAQTRATSRLRGTGPPQGRFRPGDGDRGARGLRVDSVGHVRPHQVPGPGDARRVPGGEGSARTASGEALHPKRQQRIPGGGRVVLRLPGGGGHGDPLEREPAQVTRDVEDGLVSVERARDVYGVVLKEGERPGTYTVDAEATARHRKEATLETDA